MPKRSASPAAVLASLGAVFTASLTTLTTALGPAAGAALPFRSVAVPAAKEMLSVPSPLMSVSVTVAVLPASGMYCTAPGTSALALSCVVDSGVPATIGAGVDHVMIGVARSIWIVAAEAPAGYVLSPEYAAVMVWSPADSAAVSNLAVPPT